MQNEERCPDRRRDQRRDAQNADPEVEVSLHDQEQRHGDRRSSPRRRNERVNLSFEISLSGQDGKTINVSASGVCLEVALKDKEAFSLGTIIPLQINTATITPGSLESKHKLCGRGTVIRNWVVENPDRENSLCVALEFTERLNVELIDD
ncbi:MAG: PilZ domain-containing protein [Candidatus Scalindua sp.]